MSSFKEKTILKSFKAIEISPFNPNTILKRFNNTTLEDLEITLVVESSS